MIDKIEMTGNDYELSDSFKKYAEKKIGRLDRYLPRGYKKDVVARMVVAEIGKNKGEKYEITVAMDIPGGKVIAAKDECSNVFAGVDLVEAKLIGQIRRYKLEVQPHRQKRGVLWLKRR
ncbi:ribosome-associated translation inhibitor RaiA [Candidatus Saccharibacteria bacterium]|nr:ribosome-associated translation inhibitor RaiA [Candidatus Saccharibacteria bacterium]